ncbi:pyridoxamine 5'-phosphate oxidase family protein [Telluria mixta]|uniref:Pyridoxamine 5'-phosphate oxidase family protein n=1 Tax=Telluria mixta TaxID=34071 RepID=A0ABT2BSA6_9BURK|nr:pyridoxamine 5'-phosphate oxidase family protein [Telluria mixta]MCS0628004.1 pyridoxamine 5'-phosphate oxidase family protein [Telluria mixta]WEM93878.1 pyridoxamine 5'-phosphate oxidase family protein [Telluria mixta]
MDGDRIPMPFHKGELIAQALAGVDPFNAPIRNRMPDQHRTFFPLLPFLALAVADADGWPLATLVQGPPGFASSPDPARLDVAALPSPDDPVRTHLAAGARVGMLGIDLATRRRNRLNGVVAALGETGFAVDVAQSFGNCPRYIHVRSLQPVERTPGAVIAFDAGLPGRARAMLAETPTLFVASASGTEAQDGAAGLDISHRGGPAGFARLDGDVLVVPDYAGNRYFNTLGNFLAEPRAAIVVADFATGDVLQLQGVVEVDWEADEPERTPPVERTWRFRIVRGWLRPGAFGLAG